MSEYLRHYLGPGRRDAAVGKEIRFKTSFHNTVYDVLRFRGYKETESELDWDIYWCDKEWIHDNLDHIHLQVCNSRYDLLANLTPNLLIIN